MPLAKVDTRSDEERSKHNARMKRYYTNNPEQRLKIIQKLKEKYAADESYRTLVKERNRVRRIRLKEIRNID